MSRRPFNAGEAFAFLDKVAMRFGSSKFLSIEPAWDAAWIACMTIDPRHEVAAQTALADCVVEVDRFSVALLPAPIDAPAAQAFP